MKTNFLKIAKVTLVLVYAVIIAGALVRMTGSGMGCPDWPKCFGYYIPPTDAATITYTPEKTYEKGQMIIHDQALWSAKNDVVATEEWQAENWEKYTRHDYAEFNAMHTWTEYINRLCGAVAGIATLVMGFASIRYWRTKKSVPILSWLTVFLMGFQAWLGATVVYSVLNPVRITLHMLVALVIVAFILKIIDLVRVEADVKIRHKKFYYLLVVSIALTLIQVTIGTQVRQFVDHQVKALGYDQMELVLANPELSFYVHRSLSIAVVAVFIALYYVNRNKKLGFNKTNWLLFVLALEIISGVAMNYFAFPFGMQTLHLVAASILFGIQYFLYLEYKNHSKSSEKAV